MKYFAPIEMLRIYRAFFPTSRCSLTFLIYLFIRFAGISYGRFIAIRYKFKLSTYVEEPLVVGCRGCVQRDLTLWPWSWTFTFKCEYFMNQEE